MIRMVVKTLISGFRTTEPPFARFTEEVAHDDSSFIYQRYTIIVNCIFNLNPELSKIDPVVSAKLKISHHPRQILHPSSRESGMKSQTVCVKCIQLVYL